MSATNGSRNIVLLSDGTGNSSAKLMKTNVWRMYQAVDLSAGRQLALYDNGVGTSTFKLFAFLGGAFGFGLKRNVRTLYTFACRNYRAETEHADADRLFAFGFSRGAFTVRVLIDLIEDQGLVTGAHGAELERMAKWAYRAYRRKFNATQGLVTPLRNLRDALLRWWEDRRHLTRYDQRHNARPRVAFLGLWDTVDAYGLPIDEMTRGWDQWVWPLRMCKEPPRIADKVCHAVALDDERHTFHPVLIDEAEHAEVGHVDQETITQVWFAGAHSNVGGGYPDDSLARVPLVWMGAEAAKRGLRLHAFETTEWDAHADPHGPAYDSRRGLGSYYRYNPRSIERLTDDPFAQVRVPRVKIHESVFQRIGVGRDDYAPIVLPETYAVVTDKGTVVGATANPYEHVTQAASRCADQERVWNLVWLRRIVYFATVALSALLTLAPFIPTGGLLDDQSRALSGVIELAGKVLPDMAQSWVSYYSRRPFQLVVGGGLLAVLLSLSSFLQGAIKERMHHIWDAIFMHPAAEVVPSEPPRDIVYRIRANPGYRWFVDRMSQRVFPVVFGLGALATIALATLGTLNRAAFAAASAGGAICADVAPRPPDNPRTRSWIVGDFPNTALCHATGIPVDAGTRYEVTVTLPPGGWTDRGHVVERPAGFGTPAGGIPFFFGLPFRRVLTADWFVPMVRIGSLAAEYHALDQGAITFTAARDGQMFLFVNDAIGIWPFWSSFYENNGGDTPIVTVQALGPDEAR